MVYDTESADALVELDKEAHGALRVARCGVKKSLKPRAAPLRHQIGLEILPQRGRVCEGEVLGAWFEEEVERIDDGEFAWRSTSMANSRVFSAKNTRAT